MAGWLRPKSLAYYNNVLRGCVKIKARARSARAASAKREQRSRGRARSASGGSEDTSTGGLEKSRLCKGSGVVKQENGGWVGAGGHARNIFEP